MSHYKNKTFSRQGIEPKILHLWNTRILIESQVRMLDEFVFAIGMIQTPIAFNNRGFVAGSFSSQSFRIRLAIDHLFFIWLKFWSWELWERQFVPSPLKKTLKTNSKKFIPDQCDQIEKLFSNIWPLITMKIFTNGTKKSLSRFKNGPNPQ